MVTGQQGLARAATKAPGPLYAHDARLARAHDWAQAQAKRHEELAKSVNTGFASASDRGISNSRTNKSKKNVNSHVRIRGVSTTRAASTSTSGALSRPTTVRRPATLKRPHAVSKPRPVKRLHAATRPRTVKKLHAATRRHGVTKPRTVYKPHTASKPRKARDSGASATPGDVAANWALSQLGKPYRWAAAGPNAFDCSGLTMRAWQHAGVLLDHWTGTQWTSGPHIPLDQLDRGDLVFFGGNGAKPSTIEHVGIYIGNDQMVDAPHDGANVRIETIHEPGLIGATRPT